MTLHESGVIYAFDITMEEFNTNLNNMSDEEVFEKFSSEEYYNLYIDYDEGLKEEYTYSEYLATIENVKLMLLKSLKSYQNYYSQTV